MASRTLDTTQPVSSTTRADIVSPAVGDVCLISTAGQKYFREPIEIYTTHDLSQVTQILETIDHRVRSESLYAVGYLAYEAAPAFDSALVTHPPGDQPLLWFGLYDNFETTLPESKQSQVPPPQWEPSLSATEFASAIDRIRDYIAAGDTYQVNFTFPLTSDFSEDPYAWFLQITAAQSADYCAYINTGTHIVISASPELFFKLDGTRLTTTPMKGTIARGLNSDADAIQRERLLSSEKDRAENIMIVDLIRNDMGRISETGSVKVESKFEAAKFDSLWQMTSTITSTTHAEIPEIFQALFPSGSVTGAPKIRTTEIIRELETSPRGAYCGAIGWWGPNRKAEFNVSIRTATLNVEEETIRYPVGAGITWDSSTDAEYAECLLKAEVVSQPRPDFDLLESLLWDGAEYFLLQRHIERLAQSADYFGYRIDEAKVRTALIEASCKFPKISTKVRLLLNKSGSIQIEPSKIIESAPPRVALAKEPVDSQNLFLYHKTTNRSVYTNALHGVDADDAILWNERGEITESTRANIIIRHGTEWLTPPVDSGLLPGTYRAQLLEEQAIREAVISLEDLRNAEEICLINSVRRRIPVAPKWDSGNLQWKS